MGSCKVKKGSWFWELRLLPQQFHKDQFLWGQGIINMSGQVKEKVQQQGSKRHFLLCKTSIKCFTIAQECGDYKCSIAEGV